MEDAKTVEVVVVGKSHSRVEMNEDGENVRVMHPPGTILNVSHREQEVFSHRLALNHPPVAEEAADDDDDDDDDDVDLPEGVTVEDAGGSWRLVRSPNDPDGTKVNGKKALAELLDELREDDD